MSNLTSHLVEANKREHIKTLHYCNCVMSIHCWPLDSLYKRPVVQYSYGITMKVIDIPTHFTFMVIWLLYIFINSKDVTFKSLVSFSPQTVASLKPVHLVSRQFRTIWTIWYSNWYQVQLPILSNQFLWTVMDILKMCCSEAYMTKTTIPSYWNWYILHHI